MVLFNYSTKEITAKIVYYGPGLCGKTTNLQFIYDSLPRTINKGKMLSLATKTDRTLFFDFLPIDLGTIRGMRTRLQLYTVPGQVFYNTTRKLVLKGADGVVFVADSQKRMIDANLESFGNLEENLAEHDMKLSDIPMILQFNKRDLPDVATIEELNAALNKFNAPIYEAVAPTGIGVHETLKAITKLVLNSLKERYADKREAKTDAKAKASALMAATMNRPAAAEARPSAHAPAPEAAPGIQAPAVAARQHMEAAVDAPAAASVSPAKPPAATPEPVQPLSRGDDGPLSFDLPELEELAEGDGGGVAAESDGAIDLTLSEPELDPVSMRSPASSTDLMTALSADLAGEDELLELTPETDTPIETGGEDLLELAEEPLADLAHLEDSIGMPVLDVTSEMPMGDEPGSPAAIEPEATAIPVARDMSADDGFESTSLDTSAEIESMLRQDSRIDVATIGGDAFDESFFEPVEAGTVVPEDHHDTADPVAELGPVSADAPIPLAFEPSPQPHREESGAFSPSSMPRIPLSNIASPAASVAGEISREQGMAREINLPVKLEIGGRCISFELKISLDLTEVTAHAVATTGDGHEARS